MTDLILCISGGKKLEGKINKMTKLIFNHQIDWKQS